MVYARERRIFNLLYKETGAPKDSPTLIMLTSTRRNPEIPNEYPYLRTSHNT